MIRTYAEEEVLSLLANWAKQTDAISAMLLTSTRANPTATVDALSDYDVILIVEDIHPFNNDRGWLKHFGNVLVSYWDHVYRDPINNIEIVANVIQYTDGLKIDFTLWPVELLHKIIADSQFLPELDAGYRILYDRDDLTTRLQRPTYRSYIPARPSNEQYQKTVEDFFSDVPYAAKCLLRNELLPLKWCLDYDMKHLFLRRMLEWKVEIDNGWNIPMGALGKGLTKRLKSRIASQLEKTYVGAGIEENWKALFDTILLFRQISIEVATSLGFSYPQNLDQRIEEYLESIRKLELVAK